MGCTESIISEIVAKSNSNGQKGNINQAKVQPAPLLGRDEARERRRKALMERHAKKQAMAQTISDNAMAEKERLSNSTWMSWRSGVNSNSDVISPAVSISVRGSDGTASPDALPDPAMAYIYSEETNTSSRPEEDINENHMQIRTMELPNQVTEGTEGKSNQSGEQLINERLSGTAEKKMAKEQDGTTKVENTILEGQDSIQEPLLNENGPEGSRKDSKDSNTPLMDNQKEMMEKEKKRKRRGKQKAVKFSDQNLGDDNLEESGQKTSKGR